MGYEPDYVFRFKVAQWSNPHARPVSAKRVPTQRRGERVWTLLERIRDESVVVDPTAEG